MYLFEYLGAFYKWIYFSFFNPIIGKKTVPFKQILAPLEESGDIVERLAGGLSNKLIGFIVTMIICSILVRI
jgi:hypothetical protein